MSNFNDMNDLEPKIDYSMCVIRDMYEVLTTKKNPWPVMYTDKNKIDFLNKVINYLSEHQMYEMCAGIEKVKRKIDESSNHK